MAMPAYIEQHDKEMATRLVNECLRRGYRISVNDGEETTVKRSSDADVILTAMGSTEADILMVYVMGEGDSFTRIGSFDLIWNNSPGETIADHTDNAECESLHQYAYAPFDR